MNSIKRLLPDNWLIQEFQDTNIKILDGDRGKNYPKKDEFTDTGYCLFLNTGNIKNDSFDFTKCNFISEKKDALLKKGKLKRNDIVITTRGTVGSIAFYNNKVSYKHVRINSGMIILRSSNGVNSVFLYQLLKSPYLKEQYKLFSSGAAQPQLPIKDFKRINILLPTLPIQKKIAAVLSAYDDLIENNNRRIAILEKMAEEIYREWFVRMRLPGHEKVKFHKGVPEGWEVQKLGNFINLIMGQSPKSEFYNTKSEGLPFNQGVGTYGYRFPKKETFCSVNGRTAKKGDILFSVRAPVGRLNVADCKMIIGRGLSSINHKNGYNSYLYYMLKCYFSNEDIIGNGAIFNSVGKDELRKLEIIYPKESLIKQYNHIAVGLDSKIENLLNSIDLLAKSRDLLLSRLLSGKLSVENLDIKFPPGMEETDA
jgi:type I restriction enzyme S subunit